MTRWAAFAGFTVVVLSLLLLLARASASFVAGDGVGRGAEQAADADPPPGGPVDVAADRSASADVDTDHPAATDTDVLAVSDDPPALSSAYSSEASPTSASPTEEASEVSTASLLANVWLSHVLFAVLLVAGVRLTEVPPSALGVADTPLSTGPLSVGVGLAVGVVLSLANTLASGFAEAFGVDPGQELRERLTPETAREWVFLLGVVLPTIAGFEELLFRGALVGAFAVGFGVSPWALAVVSSVAFALGHGVQGGLGVVVTGLLGFALAAAFVLTNSLLVVVVAHYVVNAVEFVVVQGLGWEPFGGTTG